MSNIVEGKITLYPTRIIIDPYLERNSLIENSLSVYDKVTHSYAFQAFIKDEVNNRLIIPTGYSVNYLLGMYPHYKIENKCNAMENYIEANRSKYKIKMKYDCRNELQKAAMNFLNKRKPRSKFKYMQRFLSLKTGEGKTFCSVKYIADNHERPIIFVDQDSLGQQWKDRILEYTDTKENEIFYISGAKSVNKLMKMSSDDILKIKFFICCYRTLTINIKNTGSSSDISKLFDKIKVTMKVFDEAHLEYMSIFKLDMISNLRSLYLSATPKRSDRSEDKVYQNIFRNVDKFTSDSFTETPENYHNIIMCDWNSNPDIASESKCQTKYGFSMSRYCDYLMDKKYDKFEGLMYSLIFDTVLTNRKKKKMAILFGTNALLDKFYDNLVNFCAFNNYKLKINKFNGQTKKEDKLDLLEESDIIITTDKSFCKGIDVKDLQVVINTVPFIADTKLIQTVGRLRKLQNKEVIFIDINDIGFKSLRYQESSKKTIFSKLAKSLFIMNYK
jgi:superfamily II DNA or RNA helicase